LLRFAVEHRGLAYCFVDKKNRLRKRGGDLAKYSLSDLDLGDDVGGRLPFLDAGRVGADEIIVLPLVALTPSSYADVHILGARSGAWVVFLDRTSEGQMYRAMQQRVNESKLLEERLAKVTAELEEAKKLIHAR